MLGAFPLGLVTSALISTDTKLRIYLTNYPIMLSVLLTAVITYNRLLMSVGYRRDAAFACSLATWLICATIAYAFLLQTAVQKQKREDETEEAHLVSLAQSLV